MRNRISLERWEQSKTAYAAWIGLREIARKMNIAEGMVLDHAKRHGWTQQLQVATRELGVMQSNAIGYVPSFHDEVDEAEDGCGGVAWQPYVLKKPRTSNKLLHELAREIKSGAIQGDSR